MRIIALFDSVSRTNGGIFEAERQLWSKLACEPSLDVTVLGLEDCFSHSDVPLWQPLKPRTCAPLGPRAFAYSPQMRHALAGTSADLAYQGGLWKYSSIAVTKWARRAGRPFILAPHGMLDAWALRNSGWKKRLARLAYENRHLKSTACFRALCPAEADSIRALGLKNPICIIPNGIDLAARGPGQAACGGAWAGIARTGRKVLLFLGRIHPKKGLTNLIKAWALVRRPGSGVPPSAEWVLAIAGWGQEDYQQELQSLAAELGIPWANSVGSVGASGERGGAGNGRPQESSGSRDFVEASVLFLGPQFGDDKTACYSGCDAFILPSLSEGLPMAVLEAWADAKPVLMTRECNLEGAPARGAALPIDADPAGIARGLNELFRMSNADRLAMGMRAREYVAEKFSWGKVVEQMKDLCNWLGGGGTPPASLLNN